MLSVQTTGKDIKVRESGADRGSKTFLVHFLSYWISFLRVDYFIYVFKSVLWKVILGPPLI